MASREVAVGYGVPWAQAGAGVVVTQALINPLFGRDGLLMMGAGFSAEQTLKSLLDRDSSLNTRQVALIDANGSVAAFSGKNIGSFAGDRQGEYFSIQGNCLAREEVLTEIEKAFITSEGPLALRLLEAHRAGDMAGGDKRGRQSAALLVVRYKSDIRGITDKMIERSLIWKN